MAVTRIEEPQLSAWRSVLNAHATLVARIETALSAASLPPLSWYDVLWALREAPRRRLRMSELADRLTISRGGLTKLADRLAERGLIGREPCSQDRRGYDAVLLPAGEEMLRRMWPVYAAELERCFATVLDDDEAEAISDSLRRVSEAARAEEPAAA